MKTSAEIRQLFLDFWSESPRNSKEIPNSSLVPQNDPTLLFVNSGMFPIVPYLSGAPHPLGKRVHNVQRCVRTNDIEEVGDNRHMVMFEMIGNWSLGDFNKVDQIPWIMEFYIEKCGLDPSRFYVSVFEGNESAPRDDLAIETWKKSYAKYGIKAEFCEDITNIPPSLEAGKSWEYRIFPYDKKKNWWSRAEIPGEIGGPTSEMFYDMGVKERDDESYHINDDSGRFIEIGNNVFMEYKLNSEMKWLPLEQKNIDFGGGFERIVIASQDNTDPYKTDLFENIIQEIERISGQKYKSVVQLNPETKSFRVIAEHARSAVFLIADGVIPSNKDQGYILRRLIRRMVRYAHQIGIKGNYTKRLADVVVNDYANAYPHLYENREKIFEEIEKEEIKFRRTLDNGIRNFAKLFHKLDIPEVHKNSRIDYLTVQFEFEGKTYGLGQWMFYFYETFGFPPEMFIEELDIFIYTVRKKGHPDDDYEKIFPKLNEETRLALIENFNQAESSHKANSKAGAEQKFKGGLADASVETTKLHTAHHLLLAAMQKLINPEIKQRGSNITAERLRMDFNFDRKLTDEEVKQIEDLVNQLISDKLKVTRLEMPKTEAEKIGAQMEFGQKYPEIVSVYVIGNTDSVGNTNFPSNEDKKAFSIEFCGGPHVSNTSELGEGGKKFKIIGQESVGAGLRRIKAALV